MFFLTVLLYEGKKDTVESEHKFMSITVDNDATPSPPQDEGSAALPIASRDELEGKLWRANHDVERLSGVVDRQAVRILEKEDQITHMHDAIATLRDQREREAADKARQVRAMQDQILNMHDAIAMLQGSVDDLEGDIVRSEADFQQQVRDARTMGWKDAVVFAQGIFAEQHGLRSTT